MYVNGKRITAAQVERQVTREKSGRYAEMPRCYCGCGKPVNPGAHYYSHRLTDCRDAEDKSFGDHGIMLRAACAKKTDHINTVRDWKEYVTANEKRRGVPDDKLTYGPNGRADFD